MKTNKIPIRLIILYFFIHCFVLLQASALPAQTISGWVYDDHTKEPIPFANIYFNNSYIGTTSAVDGFFKLDVSSNQGQDIIISSVGYHSNILREYSSNYSYKIYLKEKVTKLDEVVVSAHGGISRDKKLKMFKKEFLGDSKNGRSCSIENEDDLELIYSTAQEKLIAFSNKPLIINNKELGYKIKYHLEEFSMIQNDIMYRGYAQFQEVVLSEKEQKIVRKKRNKAYKNSRMEFFRVLWKNKIIGSKIQVLDIKTDSVINLYEFVSSEHSELKYLYYPNDLRINNRNSTSYVSFAEHTKTLFTEDGFFDPEGISWNGKMSEKRIGDLLPYEYVQVIE